MTRFFAACSCCFYYSPPNCAYSTILDVVYLLIGLSPPPLPPATTPELPPPLALFTALAGLDLPEGATNIAAPTFIWLASEES